MSDEHDLEHRLQRYRPTGPRHDFEERLLGSVGRGDRGGVWRFRLPRHAFALAASILIVAFVSLALAGHMETARLRALATQPATSGALTDSERMVEGELGPEALAFERQLDAAKAAARILSEPNSFDPAVLEKLR